MINLKKVIAMSLLVAASTVFSTMSLAGNYSEARGYYGYGKKKDRPNFKVRCSKVELLSADLAMIPPIGPASGTANFVIGGQPTLATATVELLGPPQFQEDGSAFILVQLQYDFGGGDVLLASARGILTETGRLAVFRNNAEIHYTGGTGIYRKAYGRFDATGFLNFDDFLVQMSGKGEVCNRKFSRHSE